MTGTTLATSCSRSGRLSWTPLQFGLAAVLIFCVLIGGTDAGRYLWPIHAAMAAIGTCVIAYWIVHIAEADLVDKLALGAVLAFLAACLTSQFPRLSFDAATSAMAFAAAFFAARRAIASPGGRSLALAVLGLCGIVLAAALFVLWSAIWLRWATIAGSAPPLDLTLPVGPYRNHQYAGIAVAMLLPAVMRLTQDRATRPIAAVGLACSAAVILMSGSRTAWLASVLGLSLALLVVRRGGIVAGLSRLTRPRSAIAVMIPAGALVVVAASSLLARLTVIATIGSRVAIWQATLDRWLASPLAGTGPGAFGASFTLSDYFVEYGSVGRQPDNAIIQLLAEAGIVGLVAVALLLVVLLVAFRRKREYAPVAGLVVFLFSCLTNNPSDLAQTAIIALVWLAILAPVAPREEALPSTRMRLALIGTGAIVASATALSLVAFAVYDSASGAAIRHDIHEVVSKVRIATKLDPSFALYHRELAAWLLADGDAAAGSREAERAIQLNPADATAYRIAALAAIELQRDSEATTFAARATGLRATDQLNPLTQAYVALQLGDQPSADKALSLAIRFHPWLTSSPDWTSAFGSRDPTALLQAAAQAASADTVETNTKDYVSAWLVSMANDSAEAPMAPIPSAIYATVSCQLDLADETLSSLTRADASSAYGLQARIIASLVDGENAGDLVALAQLRRWSETLASATLSGMRAVWEPAEDARIYGRFPLQPAPVGPVLPTAGSGLTVWLHDPIAAAKAGAPGSGLAICR